MPTSHNEQENPGGLRSYDRWLFDQKRYYEENVNKLNYDDFVLMWVLIA